MSIENSSPKELVELLLEEFKKTPPQLAQNTTTTTSFMSQAIEPQQKTIPPLLVISQTCIEMLEIISRLLNEEQAVEDLQVLQQYDFSTSFIFEAFKKFIPENTIEPQYMQSEELEYETPDKDEIECELSKTLTFVTELLLFGNIELERFGQLVYELITDIEVTQPCEQVIYELSKTAALLEIQLEEFEFIDSLLSVPTLVFYEGEADKNLILQTLNEEEVITQFDKLEESFFKSFMSLKELLQEEILPFEENQVTCPFGDYEKYESRNESARRVKLDPMMYERVEEGINNLLSSSTDAVGTSDEQIEIGNIQIQSIYLQNEQFEQEKRLFLLVQIFKFLYLIKNEYNFTSFSDSVEENSPYELLYLRQYDFNEQLIHRLTDLIIQQICGLKHSEDGINKYYENLIFTLTDSASFDERKLTVLKSGQEVSLVEELLGILFYEESIEDVKFFLELSFESVTFTEQVENENQSLLELILHKTLSDIEFNSAFGYDILELLQTAMLHSEEQTRFFMSSSHTLKLQDIQESVKNRSNPRITSIFSKISVQDLEFELRNYNELLASPEFTYEQKLQFEEQLIDQLKQIEGNSNNFKVLEFQNPNFSLEEQITNLEELSSLAEQGEKLFNDNEYLLLADAVLEELTPLEVYKVLVDVISKDIYANSQNNVVFTFDEGFSMYYFAYISNRKYFFARCLIELNDFLATVSDSTVQELICCEQVELYDYSEFLKLEQVNVNSFIVLLELLCSPQIDVTMMQYLSTLLLRIKNVDKMQFQVELLYYKQIFNKFECIYVNNKISASLLLKIFDGLDELLNQELLEKFASNFVKLLSFDLINASSALSQASEISVLYYTELFTYLEREVSSKSSLELPFNICKIYSLSLLELLQQLFANLLNLIQGRQSPEIIESLAKFVVTLIINFKQNVFEEKDSALVEDIFTTLFGNRLQLYSQYMGLLADDYTRYLFAYLSIVLFEQWLVKHDEESLDECCDLIAISLSNLRAQYLIEIESKFVLLLHELKDHLKSRRYAALQTTNFNMTVELISSLAKHHVFMLNLISQLLEIRMYCYYTYSTPVSLEFADEVRKDDVIEQSYFVLMTREISSNLALEMSSGTQMSYELLSQTAYIENIVNLCLLYPESQHALFYAVVESFGAGQLSGSQNKYTQLLVERLEQLRDKMSLAGKAEPEIGKKQELLRELSRLLQSEDQLEEQDVMQLCTYLDGAIGNFTAESQLFACDIDCLGMSSQLVNRLYTESDKDVFSRTVEGIVAQKLLIYIYLNFYSAKLERVQIGLAKAKSVIRLEDGVLEQFRGEQVMQMICVQLERLR